MHTSKKIAVVIAALALGAAPALALNPHAGNHPSGPPTTSTGGSNTPGPNASLPAKAKAYGKFCQTESKKHVAGTPGTPFSKCVTDMAKLATGSVKNPTVACKNESKKHVAGTPGTPYSQCVSAAAKLHRAEHQHGGTTTTTSTSSTDTTSTDSTTTSTDTTSTDTTTSTSTSTSTTTT